MLDLAVLALLVIPAPLRTPAAPLSEEALVLRSTGLDAWLTDPRDAGLVRGLEALDERLVEWSREDERARAGFLARRLFGGPFSLRAGGTPKAPRLQFTAFCDSAVAASSLSSDLRRVLTAEGLEVASEGLTHAVETDAGTVRFGELAAEGDAPARFWIALGDYRSEAEAPSAALRVSWDARHGGELLRPWLSESSAEAGSKGPWQFLEAQGLVGPAAGRGSFEVTVAGSSGVLASRRSAGTDRDELSPTAFARMPSGSTLAAAFTCRPAEWLALLDYTSPGSSKQAQDGFAEFSGVRLLEDLLLHLGPSAGGFVTASAGGSLLSTVLFIETRQPEPVAAAVSKVMAALATGPGGERLAVRTFDHGGVECTALGFPGMPVPAEPSFAVVGGALYIAAHSNGLREALDQLNAESSILDHPQVKSAAAGERVESLRSFTFLDTPFYLSAGYARVAQLTPMVENMARSEQGVGRDIAPLLPTLPALRKGGRAWVSSSWFEGDQLVRRGSFDRSVVVNLVALGGSPATQWLGIASAVAIPNLLSARLSANESAAIATLRSLAATQEQFRAMGIVDTDGDGAGEYGFPGEMSGVRAVRGGEAFVEPAVLSSSLAPEDDGQGNGVVVRSGYAFQVWVGSRQGQALVGLAEPMGAPRRGPNADGAERYWCCYAWPLKPGNTGNRAFVINQDGDVHFLARSEPYRGLPLEGGRTPRFDAAYTRANDLTAPLADGQNGTDGQVWQLLGAGR